MPRRMGRPGLMGSMARTAVVVGTASAVSGSVSHKQQQKYASQDAAAQQQAAAAAAAAAPPPPAPVAAPPAPDTDDPLVQVQRLAELKAQGVITEEEFTAAKAKALGI